MVKSEPWDVIRPVNVAPSPSNLSMMGLRYLIFAIPIR
jgi:hypothetical protein